MAKGPIDLSVHGLEPARSFEHEITELRRRVLEMTAETERLRAELAIQTKQADHWHSCWADLKKQLKEAIGE